MEGGRFLPLLPLDDGACGGGLEINKVLSGMSDLTVKEIDAVMWKKFGQLLGFVGSAQDTFDAFYAFLEKTYAQTVVEVYKTAAATKLTPLFTVDVGGVDGRMQEKRRQLVEKAAPEDAVKVETECQTLWAGETRSVASSVLYWLPPDAFEQRCKVWYYDVLGIVISDRHGAVYAPKVDPRSGCIEEGEIATREAMVLKLTPALGEEVAARHIAEWKKDRDAV